MATLSGSDASPPLDYADQWLHTQLPAA